jgi:hypothetical protein
MRLIWHDAHEEIAMRALLACIGLAVLPALAQAPKPPATPPPRAAASCADCGVVGSISVKERQQRPATDAGKPSGLVATVPLGGGKVQMGSSTKLGNDVVVSEKSWDVVVRLDDGRLKVVTLNQPPEVQEGDRVRVDGTRLVLIDAASTPATPPALPTPRK